MTDADPVIVLTETIKEECAKAHSRYGEPQEYLDWIAWLRDMAVGAETHYRQVGPV